MCGRGYRHQDADFKLLLLKVDGSRYVPRLEPPNYKYNYVCQTCKQAYPRKRRMNIERYRCSRCGGWLMLED